VRTSHSLMVIVTPQVASDNGLHNESGKSPPGESTYVTDANNSWLSPVCELQLAKLTELGPHT
jgi:hypothetical protein